MGLFDKKRGTENASPPDPPETGASPAKASAAHPVVPAATGSNPVIPIVVAPPAPPLHPRPPHEASGPEPRYGIRQAMELMRSLPQESVDLVVQVVKKTLESTHIRIDSIIEDAQRRQAEIEARVAILREEIAELDREITLRKEEIATLDADCQEVVRVKERLLLAERLSANPPPPRPVPQESREKGSGPHESRPRTTLPPLGKPLSTGVHPATKKPG
jgi:hypothetical protein